MAFVFGSKSEERLSTIHPDLQLVFRKALACSEVDFGIAEGHRSVERQQKLYAQGRTEPGMVVTRIDGVKVKGKHNFLPSRAGDIYAFVGGKALWSERYLVYLGGVIMTTAKRLFAEGRIHHQIRWGGNWDRDGFILDDQNFDDLPHFELL
mgnify:CR=1 FL=1